MLSLDFLNTWAHLSPSKRCLLKQGECNDSGKFGGCRRNNFLNTCRCTQRQNINPCVSPKAGNKTKLALLYPYLYHVRFQYPSAHLPHKVLQTIFRLTQSDFNAVGPHLKEMLTPNSNRSEHQSKTGFQQILSKPSSKGARLKSNSSEGSGQTFLEKLEMFIFWKITAA